MSDKAAELESVLAHPDVTWSPVSYRCGAYQLVLDVPGGVLRVTVSKDGRATAELEGDGDGYTGAWWILGSVEPKPDDWIGALRELVERPAVRGHLIEAAEWAEAVKAAKAAEPPPPEPLQPPGPEEFLRKTREAMKAIGSNALDDIAD